jgi:hypothetical protein
MPSISVIGIDGSDLPFVDETVEVISFFVVAAVT